MIIISKISHTHNQWPCMKIKSCKKHQFVVSVPKVFIITISEDAWGNSCKLKTYLCSTCNNNFAHTHNQWSFMIKINLSVGSVKKKLTISEDSWENSCKLKIFSYENCN